MAKRNVKKSAQELLTLARKLAETPGLTWVEANNAIYGPGFWNADFSVTKNFNLTERVLLQLRFEFFNIFNHPQFSLPGNSFGSASFGMVTATPDVAKGNPGLGGGGPRVLQFAARFQF